MPNIACKGYVVIEIIIGVFEIIKKVGDMETFVYL